MKAISILILTVLFLGILSACSGPAAPPPNTQATVDAAVQATNAAKAALEGSIATSVAATAAKIPSPTPLATLVPLATQTLQFTYTPYPTQTPYPTLAPRPSATPVNSANLSEQEMVQAVETSLDQANDSAAQTSNATTQAAIDGVITPQEINLLLAYMGFTQAEIDEVYALTEEFIQLYLDYGDDVLVIMQALEEDLNQLASSMDELNLTLEEINKALAQGQKVAQETLSKLQTQAAAANKKAQELSTQYKDLTLSAKAELDKRAAAVQNLKPSQLASDRLGAITQLKDYVGSIKTALGDGKLQKAELDKIAQQGVNAIASLQKFNVAGIQQLSSSITALNQQLARAQVPQIKTGLADLEKLIPKLP